jgi:hypothetical protein
MPGLLDVLDNQITSISEDQLNALFADVPSTTPTANDLPSTSDPAKTTVNPTPGIPFANGDDLPVDVIDDKKPEPKPKTEPAATDAPPLAEPNQDDSPAEPASPEVSSVLKNTVDHLIKSGLWEDFDGRAEMDFTEEDYAQLSLVQEQRKVEAMFADLVDSTGAYGKAILSHLKNGGNPDDVIDLFKEQQQLKAIDTDSEDGKLELISRYYSEIVGWKPERIKKHIQSLVATPDDMTDELAEISEKYNEYYDEQLAALDQHNRQRQIAEARRQEMFSQNITKAISERQDYTDPEKRMLQQSILNFKNELPDGRRVNDFYVNFAKMQQDPNLYIDLVQFVMNKDAYDTKIRSNAETKAATKAFSFVKGGSASNKKGTNALPDQPATQPTGRGGTDFSGLFKRK